MTDASDKVIGMIPLAIGATLIERIMDDTPRKRKKSKRLSFL